MNEKENTNQEVDDSSTTPLDNEEIEDVVSEVAEESKSSNNEEVKVDVSFEIEDETEDKNEDSLDNVSDITIPYTVQSGDASSDLSLLGLRLPTGYLRDNAGNVAYKKGTFIIQ